MFIRLYAKPIDAGDGRHPQSLNVSILNTGLRALAMTAAAAILSASPIRNGYIPSASAFAGDMPVTIFSHETPQAYSTKVPQIIAGTSEMIRGLAFCDIVPIRKTAGK